MRKIFALLFLAALMIGRAQADTVYTFTGSSSPDFSGATFTLTTSGPITSATFFSPGAQLTCNMCVGVEFYPHTQAAGLTFTDDAEAITYSLNGDLTGDIYAFYFSLGTFASVGTFPSNRIEENTAILTISEDSETITPEPSSFLLLGTGLAGVAAMIKRKLSHA